jgi:hypothetical protein
MPLWHSHNVFTAHQGDLLAQCGLQGHLSCVQWLRNELDASWPQSLHEQAKHAVTHSAYRTCFQLSTLQWCIEAGCPWSDWTSDVCTELAASGQRGAEVAWAHANGCPCNCSAATGATIDE